MKKALALAVVASLAVAGLAQAANPDLIAVRKAGQDVLAGDFSGIGQTVAAHGNFGKLERASKAMASWMKVFPTLFPPGTDKGPTHAKPEIWSDRAGFEQAASNFIAAADKLTADIKAGNIQTVSQQLNVVGDACDACHKKYRSR